MGTVQQFVCSGRRCLELVLNITTTPAEPDNTEFLQVSGLIPRHATNETCLDCTRHNLAEPGYSLTAVIAAVLHLLQLYCTGLRPCYE